MVNGNRNYPFRYRILTAKEIQDIIDNIDLSDYYTKTEIDSAMDEIDSALDGKQNILTAGDGITIENDVISASGGGGGLNPVVIDTSTVSSGIYTLTNLPTDAKGILLIYGEVTGQSDGSFNFMGYIDVPEIVTRTGISHIANFWYGFSDYYDVRYYKDGNNIKFYVSGGNGTVTFTKIKILFISI